jgi:Mg-chelatase subunit ChlD
MSKGWRWSKTDTIVEEQWKALPNYVKGENNILVMADVSGSMYGRPIETSIGLATYFAQHNKGDYHNLYLTFTSVPHFIELSEGASLMECIQTVANTDMGYSTNLEAAFNLILQHAVNNNIRDKDLPKALVVVSDMEIDCYMRQNKMDFVDAMKSKFARYGYTLPKLVLWNVEARNDTILSKQEDVLLVSGQSASTFRELCGNLEGKTAWDLMLETLNNSMYDRVVV